MFVQRLFAVLKEAIESEEGKKPGGTGNKNRETLSNWHKILERGGVVTFHKYTGGHCLIGQLHKQAYILVTSFSCDKTK